MLRTLSSVEDALHIKDALSLQRMCRLSECCLSLQDTSNFVLLH